MITFARNGRVAAAVLLGILALGSARPAAAQGVGGRFDVGVHVAVARSGEFDASDAGIGGRLGWHPAASIGIEGELTTYPGTFTRSRPFSSSRVEGLFGVTFGPRLGALRPFARVRTGFLAFRDAPAPLPCILIYPPPLACSLATGQTLPAMDVGGGVEILTTRRMFARVDAGDRLVKYPGPTLSASRKVSTDGFFGHDFRIAAGAGLQF